jgi:ABC-2 type transport system ATP-binding protein
MIELKNISKTYSKGSDLKKFINQVLKKLQDQGTQALQSISFDVQPSEIIGLIGPNGAGKTTAAKIISGLLFPNQGEVLVNNENPANLSEEFKKSFAMYRGEIQMLDDGVVVEDSIKDRLEMYKQPKFSENTYLAELIKMLEVQLLLSRVPEELSQGQRTLVEFITAIAHKPSSMILDEPTNGLDIVAVQKFGEVLEHLKNKYQIAIVITSHNLHNIVSVADRIVLINNGEVVLRGSTEEILAKESGERKIRVEVDPSFEFSQDTFAKFGENHTINGPVLTIISQKSEIKEVLSLVLQELPVTDIKIIEPPVEEIFKKYYQK